MLLFLYKLLFYFFLPVSTIYWEIIITDNSRITVLEASATLNHLPHCMATPSDTTQPTAIHVQ
ncbi:hypothetical protein DAI22_01g080208 [Oryza sativa Japonica Group]|nr:hypothetical protein DAI22_01g080208 [Oryza sativa Japonica Group]